jgi:hypothetical protein
MHLTSSFGEWFPQGPLEHGLAGVLLPSHHRGRWSKCAFALCTALGAEPAPKVGEVSLETLVLPPARRGQRIRRMKGRETISARPPRPFQ